MGPLDDAWHLMSTLSYSRYGERNLAAASGCGLLAGLAAANTSVRAELVGILRGESSSAVMMGVAEGQRAFRSFVETAGYHGSEHGVVVGFAIGAVVLVGFMLRT